MDKIALISDIHGNKTALLAVLEDIKQRGISHIYCLGDLVSKGVNPDIVVDLVKDNCEVILRGNCEDILLPDITNSTSKWTIEKIGEERREFLVNLPILHEFYLSGQLVRLFHSSPYSLEHIFNPTYTNSNTKYTDYEINDISLMFKNTEFLGKNEDDKEPDIVGYSHIHTPNLLRYKNKTVFNTGSVGASTEMYNTGNEDYTNSFSTLASYAILEGNLNSKELGPISITNVRVPYDIESEISDIMSSDIPNKEKLVSNLRTASI